MDERDILYGENAYHNGYKQGVKDTESKIVHCKKCKYWTKVPKGLCSKFTTKEFTFFTNPEDYCSCGEE